jgi:hypothetical protein
MPRIYACFLNRPSRACVCCQAHYTATGLQQKQLQSQQNRMQQQQCRALQALLPLLVALQVLHHHNYKLAPGRPTAAVSQQEQQQLIS